jgi:hypothetical protein
VPGGRVTTFYPDSAHSPLLNMLDVRYLLMPPGEDPNYPPDVRQDQGSGDIVGEIKGDNRPGQTFTSGADNLAQIQVLGATFGGKASGALTFHLKNSPTDPTDLVTSQLDTATLPDNAFWSITFPPIPDSKGRSFYFYVDASDAPEQPPTLWYNKTDVYSGGTRTQDGKPAEGDLVFRARTLAFPANPRYATILAANPPAPSIFENKQVLSRAWLVHSAEVIPDRAARLTRLAAPTFDPARTALLEAPLPSNSSLSAPSTGSPDAVQIKAYKPENIEITTSSTAPGLLVLADQYFPGWNATVDDQPTEILPADHGLRAVYLPPGSHTVRFIYNPLSFRLGTIATLLSLATIAVLCLRQTRNAKHNP